MSAADLELRTVDYDYDSKNGGTTLYKAIATCHWKSVLSRISHAPTEVSTYVHRVECAKLSSYSETKTCITFCSLPLHEACKRNAPPIIVSALVAAFPKATATRCDGNLPFHLALKHGTSLDVLKILLLASEHEEQTNILHALDSDGNNAIEIVTKDVAGVWTDKGRKDKVLDFLEKGIDGIDELNNFCASNSSHMSTTTSTSSESVDRTDGVKQASISEPNPSHQSGPIIDDRKDGLESTINQEGWKMSGLIITVVGASGDLAKKKTYPSLLHLYDCNLLPEGTVIWGFARTAMDDQSLRNQLRPYLVKSGNYSSSVIYSFLSICFYQQGSTYGDIDAFRSLAKKMDQYESSIPFKLSYNRLYYFAIPPNVFAETGLAIKSSAMATNGWTRMIIEKPFGRDLNSCEDLLSILSKNFEEEQLYRIDHYLGKEMVQNLLVLRFSNQWLEKIWDRTSIQCVILTFKEPFGTEGRGGYFDQYGIIRDIIQNHLMQVLTLLAMEAPAKTEGPEAGESIRNAKVHVLKAIPPVTLNDCLLGQYEGYTEDQTIENKHSKTPTFAVIRCFVQTPRWHGVPFIFKAGKALNERKAEMRIQFKDAPAAEFLFDQRCPRNELVIRMQPDEAIYFKTNVKSPGFVSDPIQSELEVNYNTRYFRRSKESNPDAYTRLILDVLRGRSAAFVRADELRRSWEIFTPVLHRIERENIQPIIYKRGTRGPAEADDFIESKSGYVRNKDYIFYHDDIIRKSAL